VIEKIKVARFFMDHGVVLVVSTSLTIHTAWA